MRTAYKAHLQHLRSMKTNLKQGCHHQLDLHCHLHHSELPVSNLFTAHAWICTRATHVSARSKFTRESMSQRPGNCGRTRLGILSGHLSSGFWPLLFQGIVQLPPVMLVMTVTPCLMFACIPQRHPKHTFTRYVDTSLQSIMRMLRSIYATTSRSKQMKQSDSFKELNSIVRKQEKITSVSKDTHLRYN